MSEVEREYLEKEAKKHIDNIYNLHKSENEYTAYMFRKNLDELEMKLKKVNNRLMEIIQTSYIKKIKSIQIKLDNLEIVKKEVCGDKTAGRKIDENSYLSVIFDLLCSGKYHSVDEVCQELDKRDPDRGHEKNLAQIKRTIYRTVKKESKRYEEYEWNEDKFLMIKRD